MIDPLTEQVLTMKAAAEFVGRMLGKERLSLAVVYRWSLHGLRGVVLETVQVGAARCTSKEACRRFIDALTAARDGRPSRPVSSRAREAQKRRAAAEAAELTG